MNGSVVKVRAEAQNAARAEVQHGALDHRRQGQHQRDGLILVEILLLVLGTLSECRPGPVEQLLPAQLSGPGAQPRLVDPGFLIVVEGVDDPARVEPGAGLLDRVAIGDAVEGERNGLTPTRSSPAASTYSRTPPG